MSKLIKLPDSAQYFDPQAVRCIESDIIGVIMVYGDDGNKLAKVMPKYETKSYAERELKSEEILAKIAASINEARV